MGGGAARLYSSLTHSLSSPPTSPLAPPQDPQQSSDSTLDPHLYQERPSSPQSSADPEDLLRQCEEALKGRPQRFHRKFIQLRDGGSATCRPIRVMQWNILAQALGEGVDSFVCCPLEALSWSRRRFLILEEVLTLRPDVLCLQEVDHYHDTFQPLLSALGYASSFCPKPCSPCLDVEGNNGPDGCALFYLQSRFQLLDSAHIRLSAMRIPTNQVAVATTLRCRHSGRSLCVAVTHLKARSGWEWLRSAQGSDLLRQLQSLTSSGGGDSTDTSSSSSPPPLVICGDFNAAPSEEVYRRYSSSPLRLDSAYKKLSLDGSREPDFTTWKIRPSGECRATLDYVWYSRDTLTVDGLLDLPSEEQIGPDRLPSFSYPSDHLSLLAELSFKEQDHG